jgi:ferredoxin
LLPTGKYNPMENAFISSIENLTEPDWNAAMESIMDEIHEVDRSATQIWFRFDPLALDRYLGSAPNYEERARSLALTGDFGLNARIDTSHTFLYGHRFWPSVKLAIEARADTGTSVTDIASEIRTAAKHAAEAAKTREQLTLGITAVGFMTLAQVGLDDFKAAGGEASRPKGLMSKSPDSIVAARKKDDSQGMFGFLKTVDKKFSIIHNEEKGERFEILNDQEIASASANDRSQDWQAKDPRCWEGPVPVECTSASCGTCWVGVIAGAEKLSEVARREARALKVFGYSQTDDPQPKIRLACQARAYGNATIVIPPWNAVFGKKVYGNVEELELEPVTTSAKALRATVREAAAGGEPGE